MKKIAVISMLLLSSVLYIGCANENATSEAGKNETGNNQKVATKQPTAAAEIPKGEINWIKSVEELEAKMKAEPRKVLVDLYTNWCGWCKRMDKDAFSHGDIASYVNDNFYALKFNAETPTAVSFKGKNYEYVKKGRRGTNMLAYKFILGDKTNGSVGYPTIAFLDEKMNRIDAFPGYKDASKFDPLIRFINEEHYKNQTLAEYQKTYTSPISPTPRQVRKPNNIKPNIQVQKKKTDS